METVLLLGSGTQSLAILPSLHRIGYRVIIITGYHANYGDKSNLVAKVYRKDISSDHNSLQALLEVAELEHPCAVLPMGDDSAKLLSEHREELRNLPMVIPAYGNFMRGYDKNQLMSLCKEKGYPHPETIDLSIVEYNGDEAEYFPYPAMLKPNCTTGGRGMVEVNSFAELLSVYPSLHKQYGDYHLQRFVKAGGRQVKIQLYVDDSKNLVAHSVQQKMRWYPNRAGSNCCAMSIEEEAMVNVCYSI